MTERGAARSGELESAVSGSAQPRNDGQDLLIAPHKASASSLLN
jgi:hypothetical protein